MIPFFSIIIPTYNRCELLKVAIYKLQQQTYENWECVIVDDGSIDTTSQEIPPFIADDKRFNYVYQQNAERAIARNNGAAIAKGTYFIFLDSDDYFEKDHLLHLYGLIQASNEIKGMYFTNCKILQNDTESLVLKEGFQPFISIDYFLEHSVIPARVCLHRTVFNNFQFESNAIVVEDTVLWTEIVDVLPVIYLPLNSVVYMIHENNSVNVKKFNAYAQRLNGLNVLFTSKMVGSKINRSIKAKQINRCYIGISEYYLYQTKTFHSLYWILKSIIKYPTLDLKHKIYFIQKIILGKND